MIPLFCYNVPVLYVLHKLNRHVFIVNGFRLSFYWCHIISTLYSPDTSLQTVGAQHLSMDSWGQTPLYGKLGPDTSLQKVGAGPLSMDSWGWTPLYRQLGPVPKGSVLQRVDCSHCSHTLKQWLALKITLVKVLSQ